MRWQILLAWDVDQTLFHPLVYDHRSDVLER
jgi:hypothetical protein